MTLQFFTVYLVLESFCWNFPEMDICCYYVWKSMAKIRDFIDCEYSYRQPLFGHSFYYLDTPFTNWTRMDLSRWSFVQIS